MCRPGTDSRIILRVCFPKFNYHIITWHLLKLSQMDQVRGQQDPRAAKSVCVSCPPGAHSLSPHLCSAAVGRGAEALRAAEPSVVCGLFVNGLQCRDQCSASLSESTPPYISAPRELICVPAVLVRKLLTTCLSPSWRPGLCLVGEPRPTCACMLHCAIDLTAS